MRIHARVSAIFAKCGLDYREKEREREREREKAREKERERERERGAYKERPIGRASKAFQAAFHHLLFARACNDLLLRYFPIWPLLTRCIMDTRVRSLEFRSYIRHPRAYLMLVGVEYARVVNRCFRSRIIFFGF